MVDRALNVLLVDDDENTSVLFRLLAEHSGYRIKLQVVNGGQQAIDYLSGAGIYANRLKYPLPDLVILDLIMPGVGGLEVLEWRQGYAHLMSVPVVVFSGCARDEAEPKSLQKGASGFFSKPVDVTDFRTAVTEMLALGSRSRELA
jgi:CheY-like chemotaxis protein